MTEWSACHNGECPCKTVYASDHPVAKVICGDWGDEPGFPFGTVSEEEARDNALLIAAAPRLLAACVTAMEWFGRGRLVGTSSRPLVDQLVEAIAKAKGGDDG